MKFKMNKILKTTKYVVENSNFVKINRKKIKEFSDSFNHSKVSHWLSASPYNFSHLSDEHKIHFIFLFNSLSFSYWGDPKWTVEYKDKKYDGSWGMILSLGRALDEGVPLLDFGYCSQISKEEFSKILRGNIAIPLFEERWKILHEIGTNMVLKYDGKLGNMINEAQGDAKKLIELIIRYFPSFSDFSFYNGKKIYFYKRAQLFIADTFQLLGGKNFSVLHNIDQLTACADYKLPQILRKTGILEYTTALSNKIDNKIEIPHNSLEEVEIRANTIWAVENIKEEVKKRNSQIRSFEINDHLWLATQEKSKFEKPYHQTRTTAY